METLQNKIQETVSEILENGLIEELSDNGTFASASQKLVGEFALDLGLSVLMLKYVGVQSSDTENARAVCFEVVDSENIESPEPVGYLIVDCYDETQQFDVVYMDYSELVNRAERSNSNILDLVKIEMLKGVLRYF